MKIPRLDWKFTQVFGDRNVVERVQKEDVISAMAFSQRGNFMALGDNAGRLIVFEKGQVKKSRKGYLEFAYLTELQSHLHDFDVLKSQDIDEHINSIQWLKREGHNMFLLSTNDKTVKLWKIGEKRIKKSLPFENKMGLKREALGMPHLVDIDKGYTPSLKRTFPNLHTYTINTVSAVPNGENFITSDDVGIYLWNLERPERVLKLFELNHKRQDEMQKLITCCDFHPSNDFSFAFSTSDGVLSLCDLRVSKRFERSAKRSKPVEMVNNFFTPFLKNISSVKFTPDGKFLVARDYLSVKTWDVRNLDRPFRVTNLYEPLKSRLCDLFDKDHVYDKFKVSTSACSSHFATGLYNNRFHIADIGGERNLQFELNFQRKTVSNQIPDNYFETLGANFDFNKKVLLTAWHPQASCVAIASLNCLFFYNA